MNSYESHTWCSPFPLATMKSCVIERNLVPINYLLHLIRFIWIAVEPQGVHCLFKIEVFFKLIGLLTPRSPTPTVAPPSETFFRIISSQIYYLAVSDHANPREVDDCSFVQNF